MKKYDFTDVNTDAKPRIVKASRQFGETVYTHCCHGRASTGWGNSPEEAYAAWHRNWRRRLKFYGERAEQAARWLVHSALHRTPAPAAKQTKEDRYYWLMRRRAEQIADEFEVVQ